eukprot:2802956-Ditylum_brightwellii.AAC.1
MVFLLGVRRMKRKEGREDEKRGQEMAAPDIGKTANALGTAGGNKKIQPAALPLKRLLGRWQEGSSRQRVAGNSNKLAMVARSKTAAMAMTNQDGRAKPVEKETWSWQHGACHT